MPLHHRRRGCEYVQRGQTRSSDTIFCFASNVPVKCVSCCTVISLEKYPDPALSNPCQNTILAKPPFQPAPVPSGPSRSLLFGSNVEPKSLPMILRFSVPLHHRHKAAVSAWLLQICKSWLRLWHSLTMKS